MTILQIEKNKNHLVVHFEGGKSYILSKEVLSEFYLYPNKQMSLEELTQIKSYSAMITHYLYALKILARAHYSKSDMRKKLMKRDVEPQIIDTIIKRLEDHRLLNDESYALNLFSYYRKSHYGPLYIREKLLSKGIDLDLIEKINLISEEEQNHSIAILIDKMNQISTKLSKNKLINQIYSKLARYGYDHHLINHQMRLLKQNLTVDEKESIKKDYKRLYLKLSRKDIDENVIRQTIKAKLIQKGFNYSQIKQVMEEEQYVY